MRATPEDIGRLSGQLRDFLHQAGWHEVRRARGLTFYAPPDDLGIQGKYSIALPEDASRSGMGTLIYSAADSLVQIYGYGSLGDLLNKAASLSDLLRPSRIISRFVDETTRTGAVPLSRLSAYVSSMEMGLYKSARFKLGADTKEARLIAQRFTKDCLFLQTEPGSFVAKLEIPQTVLRQSDLFGVEALDSTEVCSSLFSAIQFLNERILSGDEAFEAADTLSNAIALFDVEMLESLFKVLVGPEMKLIEFSLEVGNHVRTSSTGPLTDDRKGRLKDFVDFVRDQLRGESDIDVAGTIVEMRSRDPEGSRNYIRVSSDFHGDRTFITATLSNDQYKRAVDAHRNKRQVRLRGNGVRLKTQIRMIELTEFIA
jgi:hypothetical protein